MIHTWKRLGLGAQIGLFAGAAMLVLVVVLLSGYAFKARESVISGEVEKARGLVLMAESSNWAVAVSSSPLMTLLKVTAPGSALVP